MNKPTLHKVRVVFADMFNRADRKAIQILRQQGQETEARKLEAKIKRRNEKFHT